MRPRSPRHQRLAARLGAKSLVKPGALKEVRIDATTTVPTDLYWNMLRAGEKAKRLDRSSFLPLTSKERGAAQAEDLIARG